MGSVRRSGAPFRSRLNFSNATHNPHIRILGAHRLSPELVQSRLNWDPSSIRPASPEPRGMGGDWDGLFFPRPAVTQNPETCQRHRVLCSHKGWRPQALWFLAVEQKCSSGALSRQGMLGRCACPHLDPAIAGGVLSAAPLTRAPPAFHILTLPHGEIIFPTHQLMKSLGDNAAQATLSKVSVMDD